MTFFFFFVGSNPFLELLKKRTHIWGNISYPWHFYALCSLSCSCTEFPFSQYKNKANNLLFLSQFHTCTFPHRFIRTCTHFDFVQAHSCELNVTIYTIATFHIRAFCTNFFQLPCIHSKDSFFFSPVISTLALTVAHHSINTISTTVLEWAKHYRGVNMQSKVAWPSQCKFHTFAWFFLANNTMYTKHIALLKGKKGIKASTLPVMKRPPLMKLCQYTVV